MSRDEMFDAILTVDNQDLVQAIFNYFPTSTLRGFMEHMKDDGLIFPPEEEEEEEEEEEAE